MGFDSGNLQSLLLSAPSLFRTNPAAAQALRGGKATAASPETATPATGNTDQAVNRAFEQITYRSQQTSLAVRFQEIAAQVAAGGDGEETTSAASAQQLNFDFFFSSRSEELTAFQQRTGDIGNGLNGSQKTTFASLSQEISARFEFSATLTGEALNGFANAAEGTVSAKDIFEKLVAFASSVLQDSSEKFQEIFALLGGINGQDSQDFIDAFIGGLTDAFQKSGLFGGGNAGAGGTQAGVAAQGVQLQFSFSLSAEVNVTVAETTQVQQSDPILFDLNGDGFNLSSYTQGAKFDILGNGSQQNTAFVNGGDAFLAIDRNKDGVINSGKELFGDQNGASNGFEELRKLDSNRDGVIDRRDTAYADLRLFRDNGNGLTERGELLTLEQAGIQSIDLKYTSVDQAAAGGNRIAQIASFTRSDGTKGRTADAILNYTV